MKLFERHALALLPWYFVGSDLVQQVGSVAASAVATSRALVLAGLLIVLLTARGPGIRFQRLSGIWILLSLWTVFSFLLSDAALAARITGVGLLIAPLMLGLVSRRAAFVPAAITRSAFHWVTVGVLIGCSILLQTIGATGGSSLLRPAVSSPTGGLTTYGGIILEPARATRFLYVAVVFCAYLLSLSGNTFRRTWLLRTCLLVMLAGAALSGGRLNLIAALAATAFILRPTLSRVRLRHATTLVVGSSSLVAASIYGGTIGGATTNWIAELLPGAIGSQQRVATIAADFSLAAGQGFAGRGVGWNVVGIPGSLKTEMGFASLLYSLGVIGVLFWLWCGVNALRMLGPHLGKHSGGPAGAMVAIWFFWFPLQNYSNFQDGLVAWPAFLLFGTALNRASTSAEPDSTYHPSCSHTDGSSRSAR